MEAIQLLLYLRGYCKEFYVIMQGLVYACGSAKFCQKQLSHTYGTLEMTHSLGRLPPCREPTPRKIEIVHFEVTFDFGLL